MVCYRLSQVLTALTPSTNTQTAQIKREHDIPLIRDVISLNHNIPFKHRSNEAVHQTQ